MKSKKQSVRKERLFFNFVVFDYFQVWFLQSSVVLKPSLWNSQKLKVPKMYVFFSTLPSLIIFKFCFNKIVFFWGLLYEICKNSKCQKWTSFFIFVVFDNFQVWFLQNSILLRSSLWNGQKLKVPKMNVFFHLCCLFPKQQMYQDKVRKDKTWKLEARLTWYSQ